MRGERLSIRGNNNPFKKACINNPKIREKHSNQKKEQQKKLSQDKLIKLKEKFSKGQANSIIINKYKNHKSGQFHSNKMNKKFYYRSSQKEKVCNILEKNNNVKYFTLEEFYIKYKLNNGEKRYTRIDFYIITNNNIKYIFEVKPSPLLQYKNNIQKIKGIQEYCIEKNINFFHIDKPDISIKIIDILNNEYKNENFKKFI